MLLIILLEEDGMFGMSITPCVHVQQGGRVIAVSVSQSVSQSV